MTTAAEFAERVLEGLPPEVRPLFEPFAQKFADVIVGIVEANVEECAKIAETVKSGPLYYVDGIPNAGSVIGGEHIAAAIRSRFNLST